jgi:L-asparaginase
VSKPRIHLIATGGTIAGTSADATDTRNYTIGTLTAEALVASVPPLKDLAQISVEQPYNLDSKDMTPDHWLGLARATQAALARDDVDGVVITHGTDTMEESAFFLDLVLPPGKPVVFTGAMRPATALSADGPMNLYCAVLLAASPEAHGLGVVVVMNNRIHAARRVAKAHSSALDAFASGEAGLLGTLPPVSLLQHPIRDLSNYPLIDITILPRVEILLVGPGSSPELMRAAIQSGAKGVVLSVLGNGNPPRLWESAVASAQQEGVAVMCVAQPASWPGQLSSNAVLDALARGLRPNQARILLMLALAFPDRQLAARHQRP